MASSSQRSAVKVNLLGKHKREDDALHSIPILKKHKDEKETTSLELSGQANNLISDKKPAVPKKTLFVACLSEETNISDIIDFFSDVGEVVRVRLVVNLQCQLRRCGFVEFASPNQAKEALQKKNGKYLLNRKIRLLVADRGPKTHTPKFCIDHKVWYEDYHQEESLPIEEDETPPSFAEEVLFVANLSPQTTKIFPIIDFFEDVGEVVSVRLIVNQEGKHVGHGFIEFASADEAKRALEEKNGEYLLDHQILLMRVVGGTPNPVEAAVLRNKMLFVSELSSKTEISHIFFKDVGEVVHVRLFVDPNGKHVGYGFVEFASADEANKALEMKNGEYLHDCKIFLDVVNTALYPLGSRRHCVDHKVWNEESVVIKRNEAVEGLDGPPDFVEEFALRKKTIFYASISHFFEEISDIINFFKDVGEVVRVRLIVDQWGEHVGCGFVEFDSANEANKAVQEKDGHQILVEMAEMAPYPFRPKYNLAKMLSCEDSLRQKSLGLD